jgi:hypothetical protein
MIEPSESGGGDGGPPPLTARLRGGVPSALAGALEALELATTPRRREPPVGPQPVGVTALEIAAGGGGDPRNYVGRWAWEKAFLKFDVDDALKLAAEKRIPGGLLLMMLAESINTRFDARADRAEARRHGVRFKL